jgi:hypothetical protein
MILRHFQWILADLEIQRMPRTHSFCYFEEYEMYRQSEAKRARSRSSYQPVTFSSRKTPFRRSIPKTYFKPPS